MKDTTNGYIIYRIGHGAVRKKCTIIKEIWYAREREREVCKLSRKDTLLCQAINDK